MNQPQDINPPRWPLKVLRFFLKREFIEEIEGDLEEIFNDHLEHMSRKEANRLYVWEVIRLFRPALIKNLQILRYLNQFDMLTNYFKISLRGLMKNPLNSFINVFGLSAAIGICIFAFAYASWVYKTDQFHIHKNSVFLVTFFADRDGKSQEFGRSPLPLAEMIKQDLAHVKRTCRVEDRNVVVKHSDKVFHERLRYTDRDFLQMFTFPLKWGTATSLADVNSIILSEDMAIKYFAQANPVGETITVKFDAEHGKEFRITGVAREFPKSRSISFDFLVNFQNLRTEPGFDPQDWQKMISATFVQLDTPSAISAIQHGLKKYIKAQNAAAQEEWAISSFNLQPLATLADRSGDIRDDISRSNGDNLKSIIYMVAIGVFLLALASFNYINISIAYAAKRLKEIGLRKSIGATRGAVVVQFLSENFVLTMVAFVVGCILALTIFIPGFEAMWHFDMDFHLSDVKVWIFSAIVIVATSIFSGLYPSIYIGRFQTVTILKGAVKFGQNNPLTKILLCLQFIFACVFITMSVMFARNATYVAERPWGYDQHRVLYTPVADGAAFEKLSAVMTREPGVLSVAGAVQHVGRSAISTVLHFPQRDYEVDEISVDPAYFETLGIELQTGRLFHDAPGSDQNSVIVNNTLVDNLGWTNPLGQRFRIDSAEYIVVGVVKDFHHYNFTKRIRPVVFTVAKREDFKYFALRVEKGAEATTFQALQKRWAELFPETPFSGAYQEDAWGTYFEANKIYEIVWNIFAGIAVTLATLGLYGLVTLNVLGRRKEFSIRKVLGAEIKHIARNISDQYFLLFAIALLVGAPMGYLLSDWLFDASFTYHIPVDAAAPLTAVLILVLILVVTVMSQLRKVSASSPVDGLKVE